MTKQTVILALLFCPEKPGPLGPDSLHFCNRSQVQGSTFRVKDKEGIEDSKSSLQMFIFLSNCQFGSKFWIRPDETDAFLVNTNPKCSPGTRIEP